MENLLTYDEIPRFFLIGLMVMLAFGVGAGTTWYILKGSVTDLRKQNEFLMGVVKKVMDDE